MESKEKMIERIAASTVSIGINETLSTNIKDLSGEIWEYIPNTNERYQISNYSRVKSLIFNKPIIIKKTLSNGRFKVLITPKKGVRKNEECGRIVAEVFLRNPYENEVIKHKDGNVLNDMLSNLEWISKKQSARSAIERGRFPLNHGRGERNGMTLLSPSIVRDIRMKKLQGNTYYELAKTYNVSLSCIQKIVQNKIWKTVD